MRYYLDHNATTPVRPEVIASIAETMALAGNAASVHSFGRAVRTLVEAARAEVRSFINAPPNSVIFTSGGTEAIHYALHGSVGTGAVQRIFVSAIEHSAVAANAATAMTAKGAVAVETMPVTHEGVVDLAWLAQRLEGYDVAREGGFLICLMLANNETGVIQPVSEAAQIAHAAGGLVFVDAAQAVGKIAVDFADIGADMLCLTGHKFGGPLGIGALIVRTGLALAPILCGGSHEMNRRAGTTNVPLIVGLAKACALADISRASEIAALRDRIEGAVIEAGVQVWGGSCARLPGTINFSTPGFSAETQVMALDLAGVAVSSGSACSSGKVKASPVLQAMGVSDDLAKSAIRVSLGWNSDARDVDGFITAWRAAYDRVKARVA